MPTSPSSEPLEVTKAENAYHFWNPLIWHGMSLPAWVRLLRDHRFSVTPSRWHVAASVTAFCTLNSIGRMLEELLMGHVARQTKLNEPPLFVLGHWRSGTTLLHELLIRDPTHTYPNTYECFSPNHFLLTERFLSSWTGWVLPSRRPMDNMALGWDRPQEDEFALASLGVPTPYCVWAFPNHGPVHNDYLDLTALSPSERDRWKRNLQRFVGKVATMRNRRIVLKSPPHTARLRTLLEVFPDARFVHIVRDPLVVFPSTMRLWNSLSRIQGLQVPNVPLSWLEESVFQTLIQMYESFERDRALVPDGHLIDVRYEELTAHPKREMRRIYQELDLGDFARVEPALDHYLEETGDYQKNVYSLPDGLAEKIRQRWSAYCDRYGYTASDQRA